MGKKSGKMSELSSALRRSFRKLGYSSITVSPTTSIAVDEHSTPALGYRTVYVGKCRRAYQISSQVIEHPSFQGLISSSKSKGCDDDDSTITLSCEVVLFEHLLWMLESIDPLTDSLEFHDLLSFYA